MKVDKRGRVKKRYKKKRKNILVVSETIANQRTMNWKKKKKKKKKKNRGN